MFHSEWLSNSYKFTPDIDAYFSRIGYTGERTATVESLKKIHWQHLLTIPFECLDIHDTSRNMKPINLTPEYVENKIVRDKRGGYCFENNTLFYYVLLALGFVVTPLASRTRWQKPDDLMNGPTHMILKVTIDETDWMVDVGFSSFGTPTPLLVHTEEDQATPLETRRIIKGPELYHHQMFAQNKWSDIFVFTLDRSYPMDWEVGNFYVSTHPTSPARQHCIVSMPTTTCRYLLLDAVLSTKHLDGTTESLSVETVEQYGHILETVFHIEGVNIATLHIPNAPWNEATKDRTL
jgi:N-hydroxyarylamine O-acetyltransferase